MNCKNIQELLPLYVSRDLEENRARLVTAHVQSCAECSGFVDEYRETGHLLQEFTPPAFSDAVYAGIRQRVMREIESEVPQGRLSSLTGLFAGAFQPHMARMNWAVASAVLLAVGLFGVFFIANRGSGERTQVEVAPQKQEATVSSSPLASPSEKDSATGKTTGAPKPNPHVKRRFGSSEERRASLAANKRPEPQIRNEAALESNKPNEPGAVQIPEKVLRLELQTRDPNVRIIWLTPTRNTNDLPNKVFRGV
jgi:Putative zinc-finger